MQSMTVRSCVYLALLAPILSPAQVKLRDAGAQRVLLLGTAADADDFGQPNRLNEAPYAATLATFGMLEPEIAMKWEPIHPTQYTYDFQAADHLVDFAVANQMKIRGHNLVWNVYNPDWLNAFAQKATPAMMAEVLESHIATVVGHYRGQVFCWDVVNEAISDSATGIGTDLKDSVWLNQPGIGPKGTGYIEQSFRWAHADDPDALLFYNDYGIEGPGPKFDAVYNMVKDFVSRGVPIHGVGIQMHIDTLGYPDTAGFTQNIQKLAALGLQVHITEMDVRVPVDANGIATPANLQAQAQTYQRIATICLQNPTCTALQTWGVSDKYTWIPGAFPGFGAPLLYDGNYQPKPALASVISALQTVPPTLSSSSIVNAASYKGGALSPGEIVTIFQANYGPAGVVAAALDGNRHIPTSLSGAQVFFDQIPAPVLSSTAGQVSVVVPFEVAGKQQTVVQYQYNNVSSNSVTMPVAGAMPGIFSTDASGAGGGLIYNSDSSLNGPSNPAITGDIIQVFATGGGMLSGGASDGALGSSANQLTLPVTATVSGISALVTYAGTTSGAVNGVLQLNVQLPSGLTPGAQPIAINVGGASSQNGIIVTVK